MSNQFQALLADHEARVKDLATTTPLYILNRDWRHFIDASTVPKLVIIADNPGQMEHRYGEYLSRHGRAGGMARNFFDLVFGDLSFGRDVLPLNKSSFTTARTTLLTQMLRPGGAPTADQAAIRADMSENGKLAFRVAGALGIPVLFLGKEPKNTFEDFRAGMTAAGAGQPPVIANFQGTTLPDPFPMSPHFSMCACFQTNADQGWNARLRAFIDRWASLVPDIATPKGNVSPKALYTNQAAVVDFLVMVMLAARQP